MSDHSRSGVTNRVGVVADATCERFDAAVEALAMGAVVPIRQKNVSTRRISAARLKPAIGE